MTAIAFVLHVITAIIMIPVTLALAVALPLWALGVLGPVLHRLLIMARGTAR